MAQALHMDTLEASDTLQSVGFEKKQADTLIRIVNAQRQDIDISHLATKEDLAREIADVKGEIAGVKGEIAGVKNDLKWLIRIGGAILVVLIWPIIQSILGITGG